MESILKRSQELFQTLVSDRRALHGYAEIGDNLPQTTAYVKKRLQELGYEPVEISPSSLLATVGKKKGKTILLRADMDALPMQEQTGLPFACKTGAVHACGHDMHTTMLLGAATILKEREHELAGSVKLMFQSGEEVSLGAKAMIAAGLLENPHVDAGFAMHVVSDHPVGMFAYYRGYLTASIDVFKISISGKGCHGAMPHLGVDPLNVAAHLYLALQEIVAREINPIEPVVMTVGKMCGGNAFNVIPENAELQGTIRAFSAEVRALAKKRLKEISIAVGNTFNAQVSVEFMHSVPSLHCDEKMVDFMLDQIKQLQIPSAQLASYQTMGSEDFAFVAEQTPCAFLFIGAGVDDPEKRLSLHNPKMILNEECIPLGTAIHVAMAMNWLSS